MKKFIKIYYCISLILAIAILLLLEIFKINYVWILFWHAAISVPSYLIFSFYKKSLV